MFDVNEAYKELCRYVGAENVLTDEPMKNHTSFKIGGAAKFFVTPPDDDGILFVLKYAKENSIPYYVLGNGSNMLVCDEGYNGIIINIGKNYSTVVTEGNVITAKAGATLARLASEAQKNGLTGLEFASGIPGTVGGAVVMNAGAYGGEIKDVAIKTRYIDEDLQIKTVEGEEHKFGYRTSMFKNGIIVLETQFVLEKGNKDEIQATMNELNARRKEKQPLEYPSAGSTFKRPEGYFAGKLVEDSGLKGYTVGGAQVSQKHSGFVINIGDATCRDVLNLIDHIKKEVKSKFGVELECEVKVLKN